VDAWLDQEKLLPGQDWRLEIPRAVREADVVVVCLSKKSITKEGYVQKEIKFALDIAEEKPEGTIFLIPARLEDCVVPERLSRWQWVDLYEENGFIRLLRSLKLRADAVGATIEPTSYVDSDKEREKRIKQLYTEGLAAYYTEDWDRACQRFQSILSEQPNHKNATEKLAEADRQRNLSKLYEQASEAVRSEDWGTAIQTLEELSKKSANYKDAAQLLRNARKQQQLGELYAEAKALHEAQKWEAVVRVFEQIGGIEPNYSDPDGLLPSAQKEVAELQRLAELNDLYSRGVEEMDAGHWQEARRLLETVHKSQTGFLETEKLLKKVENEIAREEQKRRQNDQVNTLYEQAHGLLRSKKWRNALEKMEEIRKLDEHFPDADGIADKARKELAREEQEAERQNKLAALYAEAVKLLKEEKYQQALDKWGEVRAVDPKYPDRQRVGRTARKELAKQAKPVVAKPKFVMPRSLWIGLGGIGAIAVLVFAINQFGNGENKASVTSTVAPTTVTEENVVPIPTTDLEERIVFSSSGDGSGDQIFLMSPDGGDVTQLTFDPEQIRRRPSISPNGDKIVFSSGQWGDMNLYLINPDGTDLTNLTELQGDENEPKWSPDGKTIVFSSTRDGNSEIYSINVNKTGLTRLTDNPADDLSPYWNPDGKTIVFSSNREGDFDIYTMKPNGSEVKLLTINNSNDSRPSWSPNGDYIAFNLERDGNNEIYIMKNDGSDQTNITNHPSNDYYPNWSPDGKHIVFFSDRDGDGSIWIYSMELSSNLTVRLTSGGSPFWGVVLTDSIEKAPETLTDNLKLPTSVPSPTSLPGKLVLPLESFGKTIPWLPDTAVAVQYVGFNTTRAPFDNPLVRQAFAYAIDRQQIVDMAREYDLGDVELATTLTPPETLGRDLSGEVGISFDPQKAKELLSKAGYSDPSDFPSVTFLVNVSGAVAPGARFNMASAMAEMWKTYLGVTVQVQDTNWSGFSNRLKTDPPDLYWMAWVADHNDPDNFLREIFHSGSQYNYGGFANTEFDQLVDRAKDSNDPAERQELYIHAERILCEIDAAVIPIYHAK
jgi:Tol biopolymer transport system component/outer membrane protein assembly factor BamD (BamD/ComL family)